VRTLGQARAICVLCLTSGVLPAITVSYDGRFVVFSGGGKMVQVGPTGGEILFYPSYGDLAYSPRNYGISVTPSYSDIGGLDFADFSGDTRTTLWTGYQMCYNRASVCLTASQKYSSLQTPDGHSNSFLGGARLSSNGRYILTGNSYGSGYVYVQDTQAQAGATQYSIFRAPCKLIGSDWDGRQVANNGLAICLDRSIGDRSDGLVLLKQGTFDVITPSIEVQDAAIDAAGSMVIYAVNNKLYGYDIPSKKTELIYGAGAFVFGFNSQMTGRQCWHCFLPTLGGIPFTPWPSPCRTGRHVSPRRRWIEVRASCRETEISQCALPMTIRFTG